MSKWHLGGPCSLQRDFYLPGSLLIDPHIPFIILQVPWFPHFASVSNGQAAEVSSDDSTVWQHKDFIWRIFKALSEAGSRGVTEGN